MSAAKLRQAATEIRMDWADPQAHRNPAAASFYLAVADSLDTSAAIIEEAASGPLQMAMNVIAEPLVTVANAYLGGAE